nr:DUF4350 domain-containing protein [Brevibacterium daeguense]
MLSAGSADSRPLHWDSSAPDGGRAIVEVLRDHGVEVTTTESLTEAQTLAAEPGTTVLIHDPSGNLEPSTQSEFAQAAADGENSLVLVSPGLYVDGYTDGITTATQVTDAQNSAEPMPPDCEWEPARRAGAVSGTANRYASTGLSEGRVTICYHHPWDQAGYGAVAREQLPGHDITVLADPHWLSNAGLDEQGNAALALGALGGHERVVYYYPQASDQPWAQQDGRPANPLALVPTWFGVAFLWLIPLLAALMLWRGRRLGPLAVERLPVIVPPVETVIGRAGILQRSGAREQALHSLRTAALLRLARRLGLPPSARAADICDAVAAHTGHDRAQVHRAFIEAVPTSDRQLVDIATEISNIESEVSHP